MTLPTPTAMAPGMMVVGLIQNQASQKTVHRSHLLAVNSSTNWAPMFPMAAPMTVVALEDLATAGSEALGGFKGTGGTDEPEPETLTRGRRGRRLAVVAFGN